jgi:hypothetical protein
MLLAAHAPVSPALNRAWRSGALLPDGAPREAVHFHRLLLSTNLDLINHT